MAKNINNRPETSQHEKALNTIYFGTMCENFQMSIAENLDTNEVGNAH
jgi:hypothetical protein